MEKISEHISYNEAIKSQTAERKGISNIPSEEILTNMKWVATELFEPLRQWWGKAIGISSFYRSVKLNHAIGGSGASQHCLGLAMDIDADMFHNGITNKMIFNYFKDRVGMLDFDQLIWEFGSDEEPAWVHVSKLPVGKNRNQMLKAFSQDGKTKYKIYA